MNAECRIVSDSTVFRFRVTRKGKNDCGEYWTDAIIYVENECLKYKSSKSIFSVSDLEIIRDQLTALLGGEILVVKTLEFIEPDVKIVLNPQKSLCNDNNYESTEEGHTIEDISAEFMLFPFLAGVMTEQHYVMPLYREDIESLVEYLNVAIVKMDNTAMPYIPKEHAKYDILPHCRKSGGEVFSYDCEMEGEISAMLPEGKSVIPYGYYSYEEFYGHLDNLVLKYGVLDGAPNAIGVKIHEYKEDIKKRNVKENWSVLKYIGETTDELTGLTNGRHYYWPCSAENPEYEGVIDNEEFTSYLACIGHSRKAYQTFQDAVADGVREYAQRGSVWEICEDPTGMAKRALSKKFPDVRWYCDKCDASLDRQAEFDDHLEVWECRKCGHENKISTDEIYGTKYEYSIKSKLPECGVHEGKLVTPFGRVLLLFDGSQIDYRATEIELDEHCPDVNGRYKIEYYYTSDNMAHTLSCVIALDKKSNIEKDYEGGEHIEMRAFYCSDIKLTMGVYGEEPGYVNGVLCREHNFGYDVSSLPNGYAYEIRPSTKTAAFVFYISWIYPCTEENNHQASRASDPWYMRDRKSTRLNSSHI
jgi:DNA-directed RNA polymerase subunit M/transcription elongation factor TFIIS